MNERDLVRTERIGALGWTAHDGAVRVASPVTDLEAHPIR